MRNSLPSYPGTLKTIIFVVACFFFTTANAQVFKNIIDEKFNNYKELNLLEKIFVHTDKSKYLAGEICWFKIYNVDAYFHKLLNLEKLAYVEIIDNSNKPALQAKIALDSGTGNGSFFLPANLATGNYKLRAYTNWMKNAGAEYFFEKQISIINTEKSDWKITLAKTNAYEIAFFPEGGNLVNGIRSEVAFKVNDQYGSGVNAEGVIINEKGDSIVSFRTYKFGMGHFSFTPQQGEKYKALVTLPGGQQQQKDLPASYNSGYVMELTTSKDNNIDVTVSTANINSSKVLLLVHTRNVTKATLAGNIENGKTIFNIDKSKLGDGVSHFTIFNENSQPVCERLLFKKPVRKLLLKAITDQSYYSNRKKIAVTVSANKENNEPTATSLSMAVYQLDSLTNKEDLTIDSYLLLNADLTGKIESPGYYFTNDSDTAEQAADNLMLTQGWRRFSWQEVILNKKPVINFLPEINGHIITGKVIPTKPGLIFKKVDAYLSAPGTNTQFQKGTTERDGSVKFEMKDFYTNGELVAQTDYSFDSTYQVDIDPPFFQQYSERKMAPYYFDGAGNALLKLYVSSQVQNIYLAGRLNNVAMPSLDTVPFYSKPNYSYLLDNYVRFTTMEEVLREYVPSVLVRRSGNSFSLPVVDERTRSILPGAPLFLVDGVPVFNFDNLVMYDAQKFRKLDVVSNRYIYRSSVVNGILNLTSYKGDIGGFELNPHATVIDYEGLQLKREFYSPVYETKEQVSSRLPDFRNLLCWLPGVRTDSTGKTQMDFYSSDLPGKYVVIVQGISTDGIAGSTSTYFDVQKP